MDDIKEVLNRNTEKLSRIHGKIDLDELLAGLAEEAAEVAQAALKCRRAINGKNPTPVEVEKAFIRLHEEMADTTLYGEMVNIEWSAVADFLQFKIDRWCKRLEDAE